MLISEINLHRTKFVRYFSKRYFKYIHFPILVILFISISSSLKAQSNIIEKMFWDMVNNQQLSEAEEFIDKAILDYPESYNYYYLRASVSMEVGKPENALSDIEKYLSKLPSSFDAYLLKGEALLELEKVQC